MPATVRPPAAESDTADRILDAADRLLGRFGYRKMTVDDLAKEAGIGKGTVYLSFRSKEDIALACIDRMAERLRMRLESIAAENGPPADRLRRMLVLRVLHRFDYARGHSARLDELMAAIRAQLIARRTRHFEAEAAIVSGVLAGAGIPRIDPDAAAEAMITATNALLPYSLSARELGRRPEIERRATTVAELVVRGVVAPTAHAVGAVAAQPPVPEPPRPRRNPS